MMKWKAKNSSVFVVNEVCGFVDVCREKMWRLKNKK